MNAVSIQKNKKYLLTPLFMVAIFALSACSEAPADDPEGLDTDAVTRFEVVEDELDESTDAVVFSEMPTEGLDEKDAGQSGVEDQSQIETEEDGVGYLSGEIQPFTQALFDEAVADGQDVLIDVYASWCPVCQANDEDLMAAVEESAVVAFRVDFDQQKDVLRDFGVTLQSTYLLFRNGEEVNRISGSQSMDDFLALIQG